jgi:hypothetical protein
VKVQAVFELDLSDLDALGLRLAYGITPAHTADEMLLDDIAAWERQVLESGNVRDYELVNVEVIP